MGHYAYLDDDAVEALVVKALTESISTSVAIHDTDCNPFLLKTLRFYTTKAGFHACIDELQRRHPKYDFSKDFFDEEENDC